MTALFKVIYGSPLSGKTTYVKQRLQHNDLVFDYDDIMQAITGLPYQKHSAHAHEYVMDIRRQLIDKAKHDANINDVYIITTFLGNNLKDELANTNAEYIKMPTDYMTVMQRWHKSDRPDKDLVRYSIIDWYQKYTDNKVRKEKYGTEAKKKAFYNSSEWLKLREQAIERDNGECQECKRKGYVTLDTVKEKGKKKKPQLNVHHVMEIEYFPELALELDNLITVCISCHNRIHNKMEFVAKKKKVWDDERW